MKSPFPVLHEERNMVFAVTSGDQLIISLGSFNREKVDHGFFDFWCDLKGLIIYHIYITYFEGAEEH